MPGPDPNTWLGALTYGYDKVLGATVGKVYSAVFNGVVDPWTKEASNVDDALAIQQASGQGSNIPYQAAYSAADASRTQVLASAGADPSQAKLGLPSELSGLASAIPAIPGFVKWLIVGLVAYVILQVVFLLRREA